MWVFYASSRINVHHQWKRNWKICIGSNVMAKTKSGVEFWLFPLYFWLFWGRNGHSSGNSSRPPRELNFFFWCLIWPILMGKMLWANSNSKILFFLTPLGGLSNLFNQKGGGQDAVDKYTPQKSKNHHVLGWVNLIFAHFFLGGGGLHHCYIFLGGGVHLVCRSFMGGCLFATTVFFDIWTPPLSVSSPIISAFRDFTKTEKLKS